MSEKSAKYKIFFAVQISASETSDLEDLKAAIADAADKIRTQYPQAMDIHADYCVEIATNQTITSF